MRRRIRTFGRARGMTRGMRVLQLALARLYGGGWPAVLARGLGLQPDPRLRALTLRLPGRAPGAPPLRVGFAADFHAGPTTHPAVLERACGALAAAAPDVLLLAGDFVELHARHVDRLAPLLAAIPAPLGRYAVLGNHDLMGDDAYVAERLRAAGVELLTNRAAPLPPPHDDVWLCGLDDPTRGVARADCALDGVPGTRVVLMHSPDGLLTIGARPFDVALCGHTHGGQVALPDGTPLVVPEGALSRRFARGLHRLGPDGRRALLVSRGVGCSTIPVRLFARAEVHLCTLVGGGAP
ncbi:metallophosphoesterase [Roseisolibacter sp. H3M3-2]|uniref:metallophosphoesterase n=1 Tax=Roseisolibacter sp. H3M3-2 TaxID=3031323 RepID=UPI0023DC5565|nr:metallophosphoesterase [Roseisolibacter sp. H3M3-2]MDF1503239.1 metallophosphoesterase family protein [Roseisolibacter sp. H3M3-2]